MTDKALSVPVQYVLYASTEALARPYELNDRINNNIQLWVNVDPLPQESHWRVVVHSQVLGNDSQQNLVMTSAVAIEAIAVLTGFEPEQCVSVLKSTVATSLLGSVRTLLQTITAGTGMGPVVIPPLSADQVAALPAKIDF